MTPEERDVIAQALRWSRGWITDHALMLAVQALRVSRQPEQGPHSILCMVRAEHSTTMFCILPKGHSGQDCSPSWPGARFGGWYAYHAGYASDGSKRRFRVWRDDQAD